MKSFASRQQFLLVITILFAYILTACQSLTSSEQAELLDQLLDPNTATVSVALEAIEASNEETFIAPLIDLLWANQIGVLENAALSDIAAVLESLGVEEAEEDWVFLTDWYAQFKQPPPDGYLEWKSKLYAELDPEFGELFTAPVADEFQLGEVVWGGVKKDGIPSLDYIEQVPILDVDGYTPKDAVFGISINGDHRAYPLRVMDWHEMANDIVGGVPIALTYCTLCGSAIVYETEHPAADKPFVFGSSGLLYRSNKLMFDRQTNTIWSQITGKPVMGPLVGQVDHLELVPIVITTVEEWAAQHPDATILPMETGFFRDYTAGAAYGDYFARDTLLFPVGAVDERLPAKSQVFALEVGDGAKAYPVESFAQESVINDAVSGENVVLIGASSNINVYGYSYELEYITYSAGGEIRAYERGENTFRLSADGMILDDADRVWQITEDALLGPNGELLKRLAGHVSFWFGWQSFFPETAVYGTGQ
ncbi:MAG: DUF3179 domain-containing protein [Chloroflexota bacterium]